MAPSLLAYFDASMRYGDDNATPTSAAVGIIVEDGTETYCRRSLSVDAFVSSTALEYRALAEAARAVATQVDEVSAVHFHGDADVVIRAADPDHPAEPSDRLARRRVAATREAVADVPIVTYRVIPRDRNRRAHRLARAGHESRGG
jgi:hypothetical protein